MRKTILRPLRLVYLHEHLSNEQASMVEEDDGSEMQDEDEADMSGDSLPSLPDRSFLSNFPAWPLVQENNNHMAARITSTRGTVTGQVNEDPMPGSEVEAQHLLKRTPNSYVLNQV